MPPRLPSLHGQVVTFVRALAQMPADGMALTAIDQAGTLGTRGLDCPVRLDASGRAVLSEQASIGPRLRRRPLRSLRPDQLPPSVAGLDEVLGRWGPERHLLADVDDDATLEAILATIRAAEPEAETRLWLCSGSLGQLTAWRQATSARLVNRGRLRARDTSPEQWMNQLAERSIDALCLHHGEWSGGLIALAHRFGRLALARGAEHEREVATLLDTGIDGVSCPHGDRLMAVAGLYYPGSRG